MEHSVVLKYRVVALRENGESWADITDKLELKNRSVARAIFKTYEEYGNFENHRKGRPQKLTKREEKSIVKIANSDSKQNVSTVRMMFNSFNTKTISTTTTRRVLHKNGVDSYNSAKKLELTDQNRRSRVKFCRKILKAGEPFVNRIIYTDEVRFSVRTDGIVRVWRRKGERFKPGKTQVRNKSKFSVMYFGLITSTGEKKLIKCPIPYNGGAYINVLNECGLEKFASEDFILMDDNCPVHRSRQVREYVESTGIETLEWPPYSPDLNIIENVWAFMKKRMHGGHLTQQNLEETVEKTWNSVTPKLIEKLYNSVLNRSRLCINASGYPTKY